MTITISGREDHRRLPSRILEETIQEAISQGHKNLQVQAFGQHGIGGRLWAAQGEVNLEINGSPGQRVGAMGFPNTTIQVNGSVSDDVGWLNTGAEIVVKGNAGNGVGNGMAQGKIYVGGNIGARGMTMTKHNPRFSAPQLWTLGSVGDYFGEFMAGGIAVICGYQPQNSQNVLGYRPCVGMVGGKIYYRGPECAYSDADAKQVSLSDDNWHWLTENLQEFLQKLDKQQLYQELAQRQDWKLIVARSSQERTQGVLSSLKDFRNNVWEKELGVGGIVGDLTNVERTQIPVITSGDLRRFVPVWENQVYMPPCQGSCPTGIPVQQRWELIRQGRYSEAIDLALEYTPFAALICGYLCPHLCMDGCSRKVANIPPVDVAQLGKGSLEAKMPKLPPISGKKIAVIGAGPAGLSVAWQLRLKGHQPEIYDQGEGLGGKIGSLIPNSRFPEEVLQMELSRIKQVIPKIHLHYKLDKNHWAQLKQDYDYIVLATGAHNPIILPIPGNEWTISAHEFLKLSKANKADVGQKVVIIGAGNVGCDVATEAKQGGAQEITLIDIQKPASFGQERQSAEAAGAKFLWPVVVNKICKDGVELDNGQFLSADTVVMAIGDRPQTDQLPASVTIEKGYVKVDDEYRTSDEQIFAVGDLVKLGLLTDAIGAGRKLANIISGQAVSKAKPVLPTHRVNLNYYDSRIQPKGIQTNAHQCVSCGVCRDCGICIELCPQGAITKEDIDHSFELVVNKEQCIGCGFCTVGCPCGLWVLVENEPFA